jgi:hypothetical protein
MEGFGAVPAGAVRRSAFGALLPFEWSPKSSMSAAVDPDQTCMAWPFSSEACFIATSTSAGQLRCGVYFASCGRMRIFHRFQMRSSMTKLILSAFSQIVIILLAILIALPFAIPDALPDTVPVIRELAPRPSGSGPRRHRLRERANLAHQFPD